MAFFLGILCGLILAAPIILLVGRRTATVRRLEQRARTAERLAELGTLTGGLAHEIKNPLSTIGLNLQLLRESFEEANLPQEQASKFLTRIDALTSETDRLRGILEDFLAFAGRMRLDPQPLDINPAVEQLVDFFHAQAEASDVRLRTQLAPSTGTAVVDASLLKQALLNLLINAVQAMVEARYDGRPHGGATDLFIQTSGDKESVHMHIIDTGPGMPADNQQKIFHPYFSTKRHGTGLGLPTARRIIQEHGGTLSVHSDLGRGSDFHIYLPRQPVT